MPPEVRAPGQRSLICGSALEERPRVVVVLLDPGRDREHVRVEDDVLRREADLVDEQVVRAAADRDATLDRRSPGPPRRTPSRRRRRRSRGSGGPAARNSSSPSLSEIELTIPLPCRHCRPASSTVHFELSIITGQARRPRARWRSRSGTCASPAPPSSRSASMLTSIRFAPPRTCSSATATAPPKSSASIRRRKRAEPVTFVRSPIRTKPVSAPISNGSSPLKRGARRRDGTVRGSSPCTAAAIAFVCSGVEPQHEPAMFRKPSRANSCSSAEVTSGVSS